ncbi:MAG: thiazole synthase [Succinivibrionaceae bacterium]|nr:thiazole synthase [Succinivibrionaceae bacterium]
MDNLVLAGVELPSRLILGTGKYASGEQLKQAVAASGAAVVTMAIKRVDTEGHRDDIVGPLRELGVRLMPNTSGARDAREAVFAARLSREALGTDWIKVEVHPGQKYLLPDPIATYEASRELVRDGFKVFAYCGADPELCRALEEVGVAAVMPLGSPIGSARGLETRGMLSIIIEQSHVPVVVDAGIGAPSEAAAALEMGAAALMVNTAVAAAGDPVAMARAFCLAAEAGRTAYEAGLASRAATARATSPMERFLEEAMK